MQRVDLFPTHEYKGLKLFLKGVSDEVKDIMDVTGFNNFFDYA